VVRFTVAARRDLAALSKRDAEVILAAIERFDRGELPNADVVKLHGQKIPTWRLRVGKWRVGYRREDDAMVVVSVGDCKDAYR
jgi:mRNA-degrading endonuclease RelE of RelBE toxin-antitoxin system